MVRNVLVAGCLIASAVTGVDAEPADGLTESISTDYYEIRFHADHEDDASKVDEWLRSAIKELKQHFDETDVDALLTGIDCSIYLHPTPNQRASAGTTLLETGSRQVDGAYRYYADLHQLTPGAMPGDARTTAGEPKDEHYVQRVIVHEYATVLLERITRTKPSGWGFYSAPSWFTQGYEEYLGLALSNEHSRTITYGKYLETVVSDPQRVRNDFGLTVSDVYVDGAILLAFMNDRYGSRSVQSILSSEEPSFGAAIRSALDVSLDDYFSHWETWRDAQRAALETGGGSVSIRRDDPSLSTVRVAGIVLKWLRTDKEANYRRAESLIREAAEGGAEIVCTTECFLDGYAIKDKSIPLEEYRALGEEIPGGEFFERLCQLAGELEITLIAGMLEAAGERRYNTAVVIGPDGELIGRYRKQELGHELVRNTPGSDSPVFETEHGRVAVMICADRRYPDLVKRLCENGVDLLLCPSGGMFGPESNDHFLQARSVENEVPIVFVHPAEFLVTGPEGEIESRTILGDRLEIEPDDVGGEFDSKQVLYFEVEVR